jgi:hypothetical protein
MDATMKENHEFCAANSPTKAASQPNGEEPLGDEDVIEKQFEESVRPHFSLGYFLVLCFQRSTVRRAVTVALVVGPILTLINQYDAIASGSFGGKFFFKLRLTFLVPYSVSSYSSVMALRAARRCDGTGSGRWWSLCIPLPGGNSGSMFPIPSAGSATLRCPPWRRWWGTWTTLPKSECGSGPGYAIYRRPFGGVAGILPW